MSKFTLLTPELLTEIEQQDQASQSEWIFLEPSQEFRGCWDVEGLWPDYFFDFEPLIGKYRLVTPANLEAVSALAKDKGYKLVFVEDPMTVLDIQEQLQAPPPFNLNSSLEHTTQGFLPWQIVGFNKLIRDEDIRGGYVVWDTGAGKTCIIASAIRYHMAEGHPFDLALVVVKSHNKIATQRKLLKLAGIDSLVIADTIQKRYDAYEMLEEQLIQGQQVVAITNYEKFRQEPDVFRLILKKRNCLFFWDEAPTRISNPRTQLYKAIKSSLYDSFYSKPRPAWMRHWILTATPIENSPGDVWAGVNLIWPGLLGTKTAFEDIYVAGRNPISDQPKYWRNLERLEAQLGFMTHRVSKEDPEVAAMFPEAISEPTPIDWNPKHRAIYDKLNLKAQDVLEELADASILPMIQVMQMICDAPSMIKESARRRESFHELLRLAELEDGVDPSLITPEGSDVALKLLSAIDVGSLSDVGHTKLATWREIIQEKHPHEKIVTHSTWAHYIFPVWEYWLRKWGISYVIYTGTPKARQAALDSFRSDPSIQVFLSGDSGSDSIDIPEARVGINYNIPWKWTTLRQREGRRDRVDSQFDTIFTYSLVMPDSVDERKLEICERKRGYHTVIFDGRAQDEAMSATMTRKELIYLLTGVDNEG